MILADLPIDGGRQTGPLAMSELSAFALPLRAPLFLNVRGEHTYVVSGAGHRWLCLGRADGGRQICQGRGDITLASCLAGADGSAGIRYLRTGVCHQIANRILWPANVLVELAEGYSFSSLLFGHHGIGSWPERDLCCRRRGVEHLLAEGSSPEMAKPPRPSGKAKRELEEPEVAYVIEPSDREQFVDIRLARLTELLDQHLGRRLDPGKRARVKQVMAAAAREQYDLLDAADRGDVPAAAYLDRFTALLRRTFAEIDQVLGRADFERVFGGGPDQALGIVDVETYARAYGLDRRS
jgi:hypothetical protein